MFNILQRFIKKILKGLTGGGHSLHRRASLLGGRLVLLTCLLFAANTQAIAATQVSVFSYPGLNGASGCGCENENLAFIVQAIITGGGDYTLDQTIVNFTDADFQTKLEASGFFFMTDMETQDPSDVAFLPSTAKDIIKNWVAAGGVLMMTGTAGPYDVNFLNAIFGWTLLNAGASASMPRIDANAAGTPFADIAATSLGNPSATDTVDANGTPGFTTIYGTADTNAAVAVISYARGYVVYLGFDYYNTGNECPQNSDPWVQQIIPAAMQYSATLAASGAVSDIGYTTATFKATAAANGTGYWVVVARGAAAPANDQIKAGTSYDAVVVVASGSGAVTADVEATFNLTGLEGGTNYDLYFVAEDTVPAFSSIVKAQFATNPYVAPTVDATTTISAITATGAASGGNVSSDGSDGQRPVTARGVCWGTAVNPTTADTCTTDGTGTGSFTSTLSGLSAGTLYYVRAYGTNAVGTSYGAQQSFTTLSGHTVTPSAGAGGSISPVTPQTVSHGATTSFTVTPDSGYSTASVSGCGGLLSGTTYTTGTITGDCTIVASFSHNNSTLTSSGGGGSFEWFSLLLLGGLWVARRRHARALGVLLCVLPFSVNAAGEWYLGGQWGRVHGGADSDEVNAELADRGISATATVGDRTRSGWRLFGGYHLRPWLAIEGGYVDLGKVTTELSGSVTIDQISTIAPASGKGAELAIAGFHPINERFKAHARIGAWRWRAEDELSGDASGRQTRKDVDMLFGFGAQAHIKEHWSGRIGFDRYRLDGGDHDVLWLGVVYGAGKSSGDGPVL